MILDVQLIKNESIYCKESALATVANWLNRDYRMMFIAMLGFDYTEEGNMTNRKLGERIVSGVSMLDIESTLQYYHGIAVENKMVSNIDEIIVEQIDQKMPVLTYIQPALCEWTREVEGIVFFLVIGYDDSFVYGFDLHSDSSSVEKLLIRDLVKCYTSLNEVQLYKVVSDERMVTIEEIKEAMRKYYDLENTEKKIIKLAEDLSKGYVEEFKSEDGEEFIDLPFFSELIDIVRGKKLFVETCYYIFEKTGDEFAKYIGAKYIDIGEQWNNVWKILVKFYILNSDETDGDNIEEIISEIVECLKNVAKEEMRSVPNGGIGYGCLAYLTNEEIKLDADITFNYLGDMDEVGSELKYSTGLDVSKKNKTDDKIAINGMVANRKLHFVVESKDERFGQDFTIKFSGKLKKAVEEALEYCLKGEKERTASDYQLQNIKPDDFEKVKVKLKGEADAIYELSPLQEGMLFYNLKDQNSTRYVIQNSYRIEMDFEEKVIKEALNLLCERYYVLKTGIISSGVIEPLQVLYKERKPQYIEVDLRNESNENKRRKFEEIIKKDVEIGFDLENDALLRVTNVKYGENDTRLLWTMHHIIVDGWCMRILFEEFIKYYEKLGQIKFEVLWNEIRDISKEESGYISYIHWLRKQDKKKALNYWKELLNGYENVADIPALSEPPVTTEQMHSMTMAVNIDTSNVLRKIAEENKCTISTVIEVVCGVLLQKWNRTDDVVFGKVVSGRNADIADIEKMVGLLINTIPVRIQINKKTTVKELVRKQQEQAIESTEWDYYPLVEIQNATKQKDELVKVLYVFENYTSGLNSKMCIRDRPLSVVLLTNQMLLQILLFPPSHPYQTFPHTQMV